MKEDLVISIGGSIVLPDDNDLTYLNDLIKMLKNISKEYNLYIVVGGGITARKYIEWGRELGADEATLDELGINTSRLNARLMIIGLGKNTYPVPAKNFDEAISAGNHYSVVVMGGTHPGHTTDAVAAMLAERLKVNRLINATSVDGVYTSDPKKDKNAERIDVLNFDELIDIVSKDPGGAGPNVVFDPTAAKIIKRANIETYIVDGRDLEEFGKAINDLDFHGTKIKE
ncbi:MAG: UMP kinase [Thermoplasmata archaeon]